MSSSATTPSTASQEDMGRDINRNNTVPPMTSEKKEQGDHTPTPGSTNDEKKPQRAIQGCRWFLVCLAIFSCNLLYGLDTTIVADIQAAVVQSFNDVVELGWLGIGFPLGSIAIILPM